MLLREWALAPDSPHPLFETPHHFRGARDASDLEIVETLHLGLLDGAALADDLQDLGVTYSPGRGAKYRIHGVPASANDVALAIARRLEIVAADLLAYRQALLFDLTAAEAARQHQLASLLIDTAHAIGTYDSVRRLLMQQITPHLPPYRPPLPDAIGPFLASLPSGFISRDDLADAALDYQNSTGISLGLSAVVIDGKQRRRGDRTLFAAVAKRLGLPDEHDAARHRLPDGTRVRGYVLP